MIVAVLFTCQFLAVSTACAASDNEGTPPATTAIADSLLLPLPTAGGEHRVRLRGSVTAISPGGTSFVLQDESSPIWIANQRQQNEALWQRVRDTIRPGMILIVDGVIDRGAYAPRLLLDHFEVVGQEKAPVAEPADLNRLFVGLDNAKLVHVDGIVQGYAEDQDHRNVVLLSQGRHIMACMPQSEAPDPVDTLLDARVRVTGVVSAVRNARGEFVAPRLLLLASGNIEVLEPPSTSPFDAPFVPLDAVASYRMTPVLAHRITTVGTVTMSLPGRYLILQDGLVGVRVITQSNEAFAPGDRVRVAGFVDMSRKIAGITAGLVQKIETQAPPPPQEITPDEITRINDVALARHLIAWPSTYDGCLVKFPARVVETRIRSPGGAQIVLSCGESSLSALLTEDRTRDLPPLEPGTEIEVTGVMQTHLFGEDRSADVALASDPPLERISLLLRSAADVVVLRSPSWWTPRRLAVLLAVVATVLAGALAWVWLLRREVSITAARLASEMQSRRDAAVEFQATLRERSRLAANLHDTLLQSLRGIDFQLGACRAYGDQPDEDPWGHLAVARKMVNHAAEELRGSVWALRTAPVAGGSFAQSLEAIARQVGYGHAEHIAVRTAGEPFQVPQFVAGNLLLVAQEALTNAISHADAAQIDVLATFNAAEGSIDLSIHDDGAGFTPGAQVGPDQGHFGLSGMRERIERLGGTFAVDSGTGRGTTIRAQVRKRAYDPQLDVPISQPGHGEVTAP